MLALTVASPQPTLAAGGAYAVDDVEIAEPGNCKVKSWLSFASNHDFAGVSSPACVVNLWRPIEVGVQFARVRGDGAWDTSGALKGKINILPAEVGKLGLGLSGGFNFNLRNGDNSGIFLIAPVTYKFSEQFRINVNGGWLWDRDADQHFLFWGAGFEWNFVKPLTLIGEVYGQAGHGNNDPRAQLGIRYTPVDQIDIDVIYGRNIAGENANWITLGLNVRFEPTKWK